MIVYSQRYIAALILILTNYNIYSGKLKCFYPQNVLSLVSASVLRYTILVEILKPPQQNSLPCYHPDNKMITGVCAGSGIGIPQRIRVTTWNQTHRNYT